MLAVRLRFFWLNFPYYCFGMRKGGVRILYKIKTWPIGGFVRMGVVNFTYKEWG